MSYSHPCCPAPEQLLRDQAVMLAQDHGGRVQVVVITSASPSPQWQSAGRPGPAAAGRSAADRRWTRTSLTRHLYYCITPSVSEKGAATLEVAAAIGNGA